MSPLPTFRVSSTSRPAPFDVSAMDAMAPIIVKSRNGNKSKRWILVFTCVVYRAVHLEILHSTSTDSILLAIERLCARYSSAKRIICDRAPGFKGAQQELEDILRHVDESKLSARLPELELDLGPAKAPHFQGIVEVKVKAAKRALAAIMVPGRLREEDLLTALAVAERILNQMPISATAITNDPSALSIIRPADFIANDRYQRLTPLPAKPGKLS